MSRAVTSLDRLALCPTLGRPLRQPSAAGVTSFFSLLARRGHAGAPVFAVISKSMASLRRRRGLGHVGAKLRAYVEVFPIAPVGSQQLLPRFLRTARVTGLVPGRGLSPVRMAVLRDAAREGLGRDLRVSTTQGQLTTTELQVRLQLRIGRRRLGLGLQE